MPFRAFNTSETPYPRGVSGDLGVALFSRLATGLCLQEFLAPAGNTQCSLGIHRKTERGYHWIPRSQRRELRQIERRRLFQVGDSFFYCLTLRGSARFGVERNVPTLFGGCKNSGEFYIFQPRERHFSIVAHSKR